ncbi:MAG TPA: NADH-quinone oxidoreductase subunit NuoH [Thermoanaerobaculia bacterium]|nr:NADH-quinone oxidoreductase subunit NuoH [Thermoanaerobaculia bacterium]
MTLTDFLISALRVLVPVLAIMLILPIPMWLERRGAGLIQDRPGPNRVGPFGLLQPLADAVKFFMKEDLIPSNTDRFLFVLAPAIALFSALTTFAVIPYGPAVTIAGREFPLVGADVSIGILYLFALTSLSVYGIVLAGWSSNNKFSLIGGIRSSAQIISYELAMTTAAAGVILAAGSFRLTDVVSMQTGTWLGFIPRWNVFPQFLGFVVFYVATFAETNRVPFDLPEAEAELVGGYHTEYSAFKFAMFFMAEYVNMIVVSALTVTLFFGGWSLPGYEPHGWLGVIVSALVFFAKTAIFVWIFIWVRWTLPRFRYDQLMRLGWKALLPIALLNLLWVAFLVLKGWLP